MIECKVIGQPIFDSEGVHIRTNICACGFCDGKWSCSKPAHLVWADSPWEFELKQGKWLSNGTEVKPEFVRVLNFVFDKMQPLIATWLANKKELSTHSQLS